MRLILAILLVSASVGVAFGQAFTIGDPCFVASVESFDCGTVLTNGVDTTFPGKVYWLKGENNFTDSASAITFTNKGVTFATGFVGDAFVFDGSSWFASTDNNILYGTNGFTVEAWLYNDNSYFMLGSKVPCYCAGSWSFGVNGGVLSFNIKIVAGWWYGHVSAPIVPNNVWTHVAATYNGTNQTVALYMNGEKVKVNGYCDEPWTGSAAGGVMSLNTVGLSQIGTYYNHGESSANGKLDEMTTYNRALSHAEIFTIYKLGSAGKP
jgi:hypothetical protein